MADRGQGCAPHLKSAGALAILVCFPICLPAGSASAVTAELARKCSELTSRAFPPRQIGNPAAGSAVGTPHDMREYFKTCVANDGNVDAGSRKDAK
jgi:hypothetical protein